MTEEAIPGNPEILPTQRSSAESLSFIETFVGTLLAPDQTFKNLAEDCREGTSQLPAAAGIVILVFALDALRLSPAKQMSWALVNVPAEVSGGIAIWLLLAGVVSLTSLCFGVAGHKARAAFVTLAWSFLPWIFMGPISCLGKIFGNAHVLFMIIPFCWILLLQIIAIKESFEMKAWQALALVLIVPPLLSWFQIMQFMQALSATIGSLF